ncbi:hypothetical protein DKG77_10875 [Flagellimonas aquimarina]|uniref:Uncharacterized protein n=1 Tax=Flagellimonas aquimarina TaxID=2201895 RepID=A0A316KYU0_9FLAO|nr:hypothetical protein [Allomuricauda koreensis]PWL38741.1 hypothetical protein DKG77_10875 [Allomuricauda koreensis]
MIFFSKNSLVPFLVFSFFVFGHGQETAQVEYFNFFDEKVGVENTGLYQGIVYAEQYRTINEKNQFFKTRDFLKGSVRYDGQHYYDLDLKYNVYEDEVLMRLITKAGGGTIKFFKDHLDSFEIAGSKFIKILQQDAPSLNIYGFYEVAFSNSRFTLYTKHIKKNFERKDRKSLYYEFLKGQSEHVLLYNGTYNIVNTKKDIVALFPTQKKEIDKFYNVARSLRKSNPDGFQVSLMKRIEILLSRTENQSGE